MKISQTQKILLGALSRVLAGTEYIPPADTDWEALFAESKAQAVMPLVFSAVAPYCTNEEIRERWKLITMQSVRSNRVVQLQHGQLHEILTQHQIPYAIIKGSASARDYPDPLMRAMGDVDFLIPDAYWAQATEVFLNEGFRLSEEECAYHQAFSKKGFFMEMHHEPFALRSEGSQALQALVPELVEKSELVQCDGISFRMPDRFGHGIVLLLHAYRHLIGSGIGVRHLCDWAMFVMSMPEDDFILVFQERMQKLGLWKLVQIFSATAHRYLSIPYQKWMGDIDEAACEMLMIDIFDGGNFGKGAGDRSVQNKTLFAERKEVSRNGKTLQLIQNLNQQALERYPRLMRWRIMRPFGWIILGVRYVFRILTGDRKMMPAKTMKMVEMRKELYRQLEVFETK